VLTKPHPGRFDYEAEVAEGPPLPPRRGTGLERNGGRGLMDERDEEGLEELRGWEVLRPVR
jgi:hypothetical protein